MSRVLARPMFKKKAPKRSSKGVGITSGLMDDVAGYAEGGEVTDDRTERERLARQLLEQNRDENSDYQTFAEGERPQMYRPPATAPGMVPQPQPNPQQMQAMQMQRMAQMGMLPRFQEGGIVQRQPLYGWGSRIRGWSEPDPRLGSPGMDNPQFRYREPAMQIPDMPYTDPMGGYTGGEQPLPPTSDQGLNIPVPSGIKAALGVPVFTETEREPLPSKAPMRSESAETERARRAEEKKAPPLPKSRDQEEGGTRSPKADNLSDIKAEREAKAAAARQENIWLALMQAGLAIAGGKSSNAITNIGQGGQAGLASFVALEQQRRRDEDAAVRRDLAQREYQLQERRLNMMEPVYQAQAMSPVIRAQIAAARTQAELNKALGNARLQAIRDVRAEVQKNPVNYTGKDGKPDQLKIQTEIAARQREYAQTKGGSMPSASGGTGGLGLDLPDEYDLGD